jgi:putative membrane protein
MKKFHMVLIAVFFLVLLWSLFTEDYFTWSLETAPGIAAFIILVFTFRRFQFTNFTYCFILVHCVILFVGAKYTYAKVPLFDMLRDFFAMERNNYDKVGHFAQGFIPAMVTREILLRLGVLAKKGWMAFFVTSVCLAVSALYELVEWFVAVLTGEAADAFLGTQGYVWDTQSDMLCAFIGALAMLVFFSRAQDRAIRAAGARTAPGFPEGAKKDYP